jgi:transposase
MFRARNFIRQLLHANATTTQAVRRAIQANQESLKKASKRFNVNWKTIDRWRKRDFVEEVPMGPKVARSTVLSEAEEAVIVGVSSTNTTASG